MYTNTNITVPLKLTDFSGSRTAGAIRLNWQTTNETNVRNFEVQRSLNGVDFRTIGTVAAFNNAAGTGQYGFADQQTEALEAKTTLYYRLKMNDADGVFTYSRVAAITAIKSGDVLIVYPNPVTGSSLQVQVKTGSSPKVVLQIQDISGRLISTQTLITTANSTTTIPVDISRLPTGIYQLKRIESGSILTKPFSIQH